MVKYIVEQMKNSNYDKPSEEVIVSGIRTLSDLFSYYDGVGSEYDYDAKINELKSKEYPNAKAIITYIKLDAVEDDELLEITTHFGLAGQELMFPQDGTFNLALVDYRNSQQMKAWFDRLYDDLYKDTSLEE